MAVESEPHGKLADAENEIDILYEKLDSLWITYLSLLHEYQRAHDEISKTFSSGFLLLAQANFKSPRGGRGSRYGQDYFDDRAKASRLAKVESQDKIGASSTTIIVHADCRVGGQTPASKSEPEEPQSDGEPAQNDLSRERIPTADLQELTAQNGTATGMDSGEQCVGADIDPPRTKPPANRKTDPLRWFGVLVPQELRNAQAQFANAFESPVAGAVNAARNMRQIEAEIRKVRKEIKKAEKFAGSAV